MFLCVYHGILPVQFVSINISSQCKYIQFTQVFDELIRSKDSMYSITVVSDFSMKSVMGVVYGYNRNIEKNGKDK